MEKALNSKEKECLLQVVRKVIEEQIFGITNISLYSPQKSLYKRNNGVFVSLHKEGKLRGCVGVINPSVHLIETVEKIAYSSAFEDPRFPSLTKETYKNIAIEISVIERPKVIKSLEEIKIGTHGIIIRKGVCHGLLLPQVAIEYNLDKTQFLEQVSIKASLSKDAWRTGAEIQIFRAQIFSDKH